MGLYGLPAQAIFLSGPFPGGRFDPAAKQAGAFGTGLDKLTIDIFTAGLELYASRAAVVER